MVLISSLLLLVVVTLLAAMMFRMNGIDEKIAGNTREKQRALQVAVTAQDYAEWWLSNGNAGAPLPCSGTSANLQVCSNAPSNFATLPWVSGSAAVGFTYTPQNVTAGSYYASPLMYVTYLGIGTAPAGGQGSVYKVDAVGYGGSPSTAAVVESTYIVQTSSQDMTQP
jgi:type IV pilus assembly protein PilX